MRRSSGTPRASAVVQPFQWRRRRGRGRQGAARTWAAVAAAEDGNAAAGDVADGDNAAGEEDAAADTMQRLSIFLEDDLINLFNDKGIDSSKYAKDVQFIDPITKYDNLEGYLLNIRMLRYLFSPEFILHGIRRTGCDELTTRWSMNMRFNLLPWRPTVQFTGRSILTADIATEKFTRHVDVWDSVEDNQYFSMEALRDLLGQLLNVRVTPSLETPTFTTLLRYRNFEVRRYDSFSVAETPMAGAAAGAAGLAGGAGFNTLAGYIFGDNASGKSMSMTTPVFTAPSADDDTSEPVMQFVIGSDGGAELPAPKSGAVKLKRVDGGRVFAVIQFSGIPLAGDVDRARQELVDAMRLKNLPTDGRIVLARYNEPTTPPPLKRNELLMELDPGCVDM